MLWLLGRFISYQQVKFLFRFGISCMMPKKYLPLALIREWIVYCWAVYHFNNFCQVKTKLLSLGIQTEVKMIFWEYQWSQLEKMFKFSKMQRHQPFEWLQSRLNTYNQCLVQHNKQYHMKVLLNSFHLNRYTLGFWEQTKILDSMINSTTWKYCSMAFIWMGHTLGFCLHYKQHSIHKDLEWVFSLKI